MVPKPPHTETRSPLTPRHTPTAPRTRYTRSPYTHASPRTQAAKVTQALRPQQTHYRKHTLPMTPQAPRPTHRNTISPHTHTAPRTRYTRSPYTHASPRTQTAKVTQALMPQRVSVAHSPRVPTTAYSQSPSKVPYALTLHPTPMLGHAHYTASYSPWSP